MISVTGIAPGGGMGLAAARFPSGAILKNCVLIELLEGGEALLGGFDFRDSGVTKHNFAMERKKQQGSGSMRAN